MLNNTDKHNDAFNEALRSKLQNFEMPVDDALWKGIQSGIAQPAKRKIGWFWMVSGMAATIALLITLPIFDVFETPSDNVAQVVNSKGVKPKVDAVGKVEDNQLVQIQNSSPEKQIKLTKFQKINSEKSALMPESEPESNIAQPDLIAQTQNSVSSNSPQITNNKANPVAEKVLKDSVRNEQPKLLALESENPVWEDPVKPDRKSGLSLLAMAGSSPGASNAQSPLTSAAFFGKPRMSIMAAESASTYVYPAEFYNSIDYKTPISAGIGISVPLAKRLYFETGITYTYLLTQYNAENIDAQMKLHYIGLPCRFNLKLIQKSKWNVYTALGGAVEKGIWSVYEQNQHFSNNVITTTISKPIDGFQWSTSLSVGASCNLSQKIAIYAEPKLAYYFANEQPTSIRTTAPLNLGFEAGLRFGL